MNEHEATNKIGQLIYLGVPIISLLVVTGGVSDPVNSTKLAALITLAVSVLFLLALGSTKRLLSMNRALALVSLVFLISSFASVLASASPISQNIYGVYGRSTGFFAYFALIILMLGAASISQIAHHKKIVMGLLFSGFINVVYCAWVLAFGDFIGWSNPYGEILGLLGNPNFIGAFLGMFIAGTVAKMLQAGLSIGWRVFGFVVVSIAFFEILKSKAIQGIVVTAIGLALVGFLYLWSRGIKSVWLVLYVAIFSLLGTTSVFGALQKGPFAFIYKRSVSLRGTYWESGVEMGLSKPFTGVGMDAYGDWYRRARPPRALIDTPGVETVTNAAHNVFLDLFAYGGFPLLISYVTLLTLGLRAGIKVLCRRSSYDGTFVALAIVWVCYHVQSIISINQIGLAVWGWVLTGALISYQRISNPTNDSGKAAISSRRSQSRNSPTTQGPVSSGLIAGIGLVFGLILALPPVAADNKWWNALQSRNVEKLEDSLAPSYFNPSNSQKYAQAVNLLAESNLPDLALKYARDAVEFNPEDFIAWFQLYSLPNVPAAEKDIALVNLKRLDPNNPDVTKR